MNVLKEKSGETTRGFMSPKTNKKKRKKDLNSELLEKQRRVFIMHLVFVSGVLLLISILTSSCGPQTVNVGGTVEHKIELDLGNVEKYFRTKCESEQSENIDLCADEKMTDFLSFLIK